MLLCEKGFYFLLIDLFTRRNKIANKAASGGDGPVGSTPGSGSNELNDPDDDLDHENKISGTKKVIF